MEAVPKVPMLQFSLKQTQQKSSFSRLKQYIAEYYQEDPETFSKEIHELETLRAAAYNPSIDENGYNVIKRYYCQLHSLQNRFPIENDRNLVSFSWRDIYSSNTTQSTDIRHDMAVALYNYGALQTQLAASASRSTEDDMKLACTHFQRAAWAFETIRGNYQMATTGDLYPELLIFMQNISFAQAQECILEKSLIDNRKAIIVAKVTAQIIEYYNSAFAALLSGGEEGVIAEIVGSRLFKEWRQYIQFKVQYMACILLLYQGQQAEEQQKMGERVTLYQAAADRLEDACKEAKHLNNVSDVKEALTFVMDVVEAKRKAAKNENEFIYHEEVPELSSIATVPGANLVKGIPFNVTDPAMAAEDIFHRLVPIRTHENSSLYSEEKANLLRKITKKIEAKDTELNKFMESLNIDSLNYDASIDLKLPQALIDRCADLNARPDAIPDLISKMSSLAEICVDVENMLQSIQELLSKEEFYEKDFQQTMGYRDRPSSHFVELNREFMKYQEAHNKAGDSNDTLRKAMELHVNNLKILSKSLSEVQAAIPTCSVEIDPKLLAETQMLLNKVNEMRSQRAQLYSTLSENIQKDDITGQLIAWGENEVDKLFKTELAKHEQLVNIIEQNLVAQGNILKSFTDAYAKCAHFIKIVSETRHKREIFFSSLIASYDVYDDLLGKSLKGLEFYKKLQNNIHKLCARVRSARDVHDEERQQRIESMNKKSFTSVQTPSASVTVCSTMPAYSITSNIEYPTVTKPTIADYAVEKLDRYRSTVIRPTPIGQENPEYHPHDLVSQSPAPMIYDATNASSLLSTVSFATTYNYAASPTTSMTASQPYSQPYSQPTTHQTSSQQTTSSYTNPSNTYYNNNRFGSNAGFVNPIYNNLPAANTLNEPKNPAEIPQAPQAPQVAHVPQASTGLNTNPYVSNRSSVSAHTTPVHHYNFGAANSMPNASDQTYSNPYSNYSQGNTSNVNMNSYGINSQYTPAQPVTTPTSTYYPHESVSNAYQPSMNFNANPQNATSNATAYNNQQFYNANLNASANTSTQSNLYQPSVSNNQYMQQNQPSHIQSHSNTGMVYGYMPTYSSQEQQQQQQQQPQYVNQYTAPNPSIPNEYVNTDVNMQNNQYSMPSMTEGYPSSSMSYSIPSQQYDSTYNYPVNNGTNYAEAQQPTVQVPPAAAAAAAAVVSPHPQPKPVSGVIVKSSKIDLLSDLDNISDIPAPILQPILQPIKSTDKVDPNQNLTKPEIVATTIECNVMDVKNDNKASTVEVKKDQFAERQDSIESALSELALSEEIETAKPGFDFVSSLHERKSSVSSISSEILSAATTASVPPSSPNIEHFYKEVQRYERIVNSLMTKTLNGTTPLDIKWKELHDMLEKDASKRTVNISRLFPEKNRSMLSVPYDHSRVLLPTETDNYINAAHIRDLGPQWNHFILADAPTHNTVKDFWCMIWSQNSSCVVCLNTIDEGQILLFPKQLNIDQTFGDYTITILSEKQRLHMIERSVRVTSSEVNSTRTITILQAKQWQNKNSIASIIGVSQNIIEVMTMNGLKGSTTTSPIILSCLTNLERSSLVALAVTCILALESDSPLIINVTDVWYRICSQRRNVLNDINILQQSMQIILQCCREYIKKKSPKTLASNTQTNYYFIEDEEAPIKDPFKDLDPLWKLK